MTKARFLVGQPGSPLGLIGNLRATLAGASGPTVSRMGFAYVSDSGLGTLLSEIGDLPSWSSSRKEWIVGLHHGITEPRALERIRSLPKSSLRVFAGGDRLSLANLVMGQLFHAKVIVVTATQRRQVQPLCFLASSANLTGAALGVRARNYEAGVALVGSAIGGSELAGFNDWWAGARSASIDATDDVLDQYARLRSKFLHRNPDALAGIDPPSPSQLTTAKALWIEAGAMSGGSRNQVEFNHELAAFFGKAAATTRYLRIRANGQEWDDRPLAHKVTTFGVDIWRLSLPTEAGGGFAYPTRVIRLKRSADEQGEFFELDVASPSDSKVGRWRSTAHRHGYVGLTSGHRSFGFH